MTKVKDRWERGKELAIVILAILQALSAAGWLKASESASMNERDLMKVMSAFVRMMEEREGRAMEMAAPAPLETPSPMPEVSESPETEPAPLKALRSIVGDERIMQMEQRGY